MQDEQDINFEGENSFVDKKSESEESIENTENTHDNDKELHTSQTAAVTSRTSTRTSTTATLSSRLGKRKYVEKSEEEPSVDDTLGILKTAVPNNLIKSDECSAYGQYVASKLRNYAKKTRNIVEHEINNVLFMADMGNYDNDTSQQTSF